MAMVTVMMMAGIVECRLVVGEPWLLARYDLISFKGLSLILGEAP